MRVCRAYGVRPVEYLVAAWGSAGPHRIPWPRARHLPLPPVLQLRKSSAVCAPGLDTNGFVSGDRETFLVPEAQMRPRQYGRQTGGRVSLASTTPGSRQRDATSTGSVCGGEASRRLYG
jgi:hypothetical protein